MTDAAPAPDGDVTDASADPGDPSGAAPATTSVLARARALWCAFVTGLG